MDRDPLVERVVDEIDALRYDVRNLCEGFAGLRERLEGFMVRTDERAAKFSDRVAKLENGHEKSKKMLWMLSGAWAVVVIVWSAREIWWR